MKKLFTLALLTSTFTFAATDSAILNLRGVVDAVVEISITPESDAQSLDLSTTVSDKKVATVVESANVLGSYTVDVSSDNAGNLRHANGNNFAYTMTYGAQAVNLATGSTFTRTGTPQVPQSYDVDISYTGVPEASMVAGEYTDSVTFTITAN